MQARDTYLQNERKFIAAGMLIAVVLGIAIANPNLMVLAGLAAPVAIIIAVLRPFIFPFGSYVLLVPFDAVLALTANNTQGATLTKYLGALTLLVLLWKGIFERRLKIPEPPVIWMGVFVCYGLASILWALDAKLTLDRYFTAGSLFALYYVVSAYKANKTDLNIFKLCIVLGGLAAAMFVIADFSKNGLMDPDVYRPTLGYGKREANPNQLAFSLILPVAVCLEMVLINRDKVVKILLGGALALIVFGIIATGSRGGLLGASMVFLVNIFSRKKKMSVSMVLLLIATGIAPFLPAFFMQRMETAISTGGAGRMTIWYVGFHALKEFWLMGAGLNNFPKAYDMFIYYAPVGATWGRASHNIFLEVAVELGIVGMILFVWTLWKFYLLIKSRLAATRAGNVMLKSALIAMLLSSFFENILWTKSFWLLLMLISVSGNVASPSRDQL